MRDVQADPAHPATAPALLYLRHPCCRLRSRHSHILVQHSAGAVAEQLKALPPGCDKGITAKAVFYNEPMSARVLINRVALQR